MKFVREISLDIGRARANHDHALPARACSCRPPVPRRRACTALWPAPPPTWPGCTPAKHRNLLRGNGPSLLLIAQAVAVVVLPDLSTAAALGPGAGGSYGRFDRPPWWPTTTKDFLRASVFAVPVDGCGYSLSTLGSAGWPWGGRSYWRLSRPSLVANKFPLRGEKWRRNGRVMGISRPFRFPPEMTSLRL
jgi:hypothetical protein